MFIHHTILAVLLTLVTWGCRVPPVPASIDLPVRGAFSAHRGDRSAGPDNSEAAIVSALRKGFPYVEVDVRPSLDGELFLFHDKRVALRGASGQLHGDRVPFSDLTSEQISRLSHQGSRERILRLIDALHLTAQYSAVLQLDLKDHSLTTLQAVEDEVLRAGMSRRVLVQASTAEHARRVRVHVPSSLLLVRIHRTCRVSEQLRTHPDFVQIDAGSASREFVRALKQRSGSKVLVKTLTPESDFFTNWMRLFSVGVDVILSDAASTSAPGVEFTPPPSQARE